MVSIPITKAAIAPVTVVAGLQKAVAQSLALESLGRTAHINVTGPDFFQLHDAFGAIYERAGADIDLLGERMRALDAYVNLCLTESDTMSGLPCLKAPFSAQEAVSTLVKAQTIMVADLTATMNLAESTGDKVTANFLQELTYKVQKSNWMLKSYLR